MHGSQHSQFEPTWYMLTIMLQVSAVDAKTRLILYRLVNQELLESVNGVISTGKESVVFHAVGGRSVQGLSICGVFCNYGNNPQRDIL